MVWPTSALRSAGQVTFCALIFCSVSFCEIDAATSFLGTAPVQADRPTTIAAAAPEAASTRPSLEVIRSPLLGTRGGAVRPGRTLGPRRSRRQRADTTRGGASTTRRRRVGPRD